MMTPLWKSWLKLKQDDDDDDDGYDPDQTCPECGHNPTADTSEETSWEDDERNPDSANYDWDWEARDDDGHMPSMSDNDDDDGKE